MLYLMSLTLAVTPLRCLDPFDCNSVSTSVNRLVYSLDTYEPVILIGPLITNISRPK